MGRIKKNVDATKTPKTTNSTSGASVSKKTTSGTKEEKKKARASFIDHVAAVIRKKNSSNYLPGMYRMFDEEFRRNPAPAFVSRIQHVFDRTGQKLDAKEWLSKRTLPSVQAMDTNNDFQNKSATKIAIHANALASGGTIKARHVRATIPMLIPSPIMYQSCLEDMTDAQLSYETYN